MPPIEVITISSNSMLPVLNVGETVFLDARQTSPQPGDIIAFKTRDLKTIVVHRLLSRHTVFGQTYLIQSPETGTRPTVVPFERYLGKILLEDRKKSRDGFEWRAITMRERLRASKVFCRFIIANTLKRLVFSRKY